MREQSQLNLSLVTLSLIFVLGVGGNYLFPLHIGPITIYAYRLFILLVFGLFLMGSGLGPVWNTLRSRPIKLFAAVWLLWVTWGMLSILWSPDPENGLREVMELCFGSTVILVLHLLVVGKARGLAWLRTAWVAALLGASAVAGWELLTSQHLKSAFMDQAPARIVRESLVISTFGNPNNFGGFLLLAFPFVLWGLESARTSPRRLGYALIILLSLVLILLTGSRLSLAGVVLIGILYALRKFKGRRRILAIVVLVLLLAALIALVVVFKPMVALKLMGTTDEFGNEGGSGGTRLAIYKDALFYSYETYGFGIGAGGFGHRMSHGYVPYFAEGITAPHNFWLEVLSQYGLGVFLAFVGWFLYMARMFFRKALVEFEIGPGFWGICCLISYGFASMANSSYLNQPYNWIFLASMLVIGATSSRA